MTSTPCAAVRAAPRPLHGLCLCAARRAGPRDLAHGGSEFSPKRPSCRVWRRHRQRRPPTRLGCVTLAGRKRTTRQYGGACCLRWPSLLPCPAHPAATGLNGEDQSEAEETVCDRTWKLWIRIIMCARAFLIRKCCALCVHQCGLSLACCDRSTVIHSDVRTVLALSQIKLSTDTNEIHSGPSPRLAPRVSLHLRCYCWT